MFLVYTVFENGHWVTKVARSSTVQVSCEESSGQGRSQCLVSDPRCEVPRAGQSLKQQAGQAAGDVGPLSPRNIGHWSGLSESHQHCTALPSATGVRYPVQRFRSCDD
ncbi:hypothetical protein RRG08_027132 [Elysia crispata]|uniref:Uncharacterized protein n=1 Tax=Elysia crispata TaxID=231223 RepID=A0AAE1D564_9GAST|nr:hypothetical protein RRG08_027132 [Elysia crispata]